MLNRIPGLLMTSFLFLAGVAHAGIINVYFAGGQSNATVDWAAGLEEVLQQYQPGSVLVHQNHPGKAINRWYYQQPGEFYRSDFYAEQGGGALQSALADIVSAGDSYRFAGLFWFQGESDTIESDDSRHYASRFTSMLAQIQTDLSLDPFTYALAVVDANRLLVDAWHAARIDALRAVQFELGESIYGLAIDSAAYARTDKWHLGSEAARAFGRDMANAYISYDFYSSQGKPVSSPTPLAMIVGLLLTWLAVSSRYGKARERGSALRLRHC